MARTYKSVEQQLLRDGTFNGPVSQWMIDRAKEMHKKASELCFRHGSVSKKYSEDRLGWIDFIPEARKEENDRK